MLPFVLLILGIVLYGLIRTHISVKNSRGVEERSAAIRFAFFSWLLAIMFAALLFLPVPGKQRILMLVPILFVAVAVSKILKDARMRIRRKEQLEVEIERMKRVN